MFKDVLRCSLFLPVFPRTGLRACYLVLSCWWCTVCRMRSSFVTAPFTARTHGVMSEKSVIYWSHQTITLRNLATKSNSGHSQAVNRNPIFSLRSLTQFGASRRSYATTGGCVIIFMFSKFVTSLFPFHTGHLQILKLMSFKEKNRKQFQKLRNQREDLSLASI